MIQNTARWCVLCLGLMVTSPAALAVTPLRAISPLDADFDYYNRAAELDQEYFNEELIESYSDFDSRKYFRPLPRGRAVAGRAVLFLDGTKLNPKNLVINTNGALYYVNIELSSVVQPLQITRRWDNPGYFLVVRGFRSGALQNERQKLKIMIKVADLRGVPLTDLEYAEERD
jgi:hypothetical protein